MRAAIPIIDGNYEVREGSGIGKGSISLHPGGHSHGPQPGAVERSLGADTARYAQLLPGIRINAADPGMTATDLSAGQGHSVTDGTDAIVAFALAGPDTPTGAYRDRNDDLP